jgi:hypothetical protein
VIRTLSSQRLLLVVLVLLLLSALVVWFAPPEKTMGYGIRPVYVHVALIWTGLFGLLAVTGLGLWLGVSGQTAIWAWLESAGWVTLGFLIASFVVSIFAQIINWNGIFLDEPRMQAMIRVMVVFSLVHIAQRWLPNVRWRGWVMAVASPVLLFTLRVSPLVLHPDDPISVAVSLPIQLTFITLFILLIMVAILLVLQLQSVNRLTLFPTLWHNAAHNGKDRAE